jgi:hypothetical protein
MACGREAVWDSNPGRHPNHPMGLGPAATRPPACPQPEVEYGLERPERQQDGQDRGGGENANEARIFVGPKGPGNRERSGDSEVPTDVGKQVCPGQASGLGFPRRRCDARREPGKGNREPQES